MMGVLLLICGETVNSHDDDEAIPHYLKVYALLLSS